MNEPAIKWEQLLLSKRFGMESYEDNKKRNRTDFQRDYDRLIFSSPFRRLQSKTQVFPLPERIFVHNRLTHSIEVSSVGRSMGDMLGRELKQKYSDSTVDFESIGTIIASGCLAHDLGNPPFGHSGETAISSYFKEGKGQKLRQRVEEHGGRWADFEHFDGNANSIRLLIHQFKGRRKGGLALTYATIASIVKYPFSSLKVECGNKLGFFMTEEADYAVIAEALGLVKKTEFPLEYARHPLVFIVEAADDICYKIMDLEDAFKLNILSLSETKYLMLSFFTEDRKERILEIMKKVDDTNEQIAYLRASVIGVLIDECIKVFLDKENEILAGTFSEPLIKHIAAQPDFAYKQATRVSVDKIYHSKQVTDIELAGHSIIHFLLDNFIEAVLNPEAHYSKLLINRIPVQYEFDDPSDYVKILSVVDFVSSMTDIYALDLYQKMTGMSLPTV